MNTMMLASVAGHLPDLAAVFGFAFLVALLSNRCINAADARESADSAVGTGSPGATEPRVVRSPSCRCGRVNVGHAVFCGSCGVPL